MKRSVSRPLLMAVAATAVVASVPLAWPRMPGSPVSYVVTVVLLGAVVIRLDRTVGFSDLVAVALTGWAVAHLAGGLIELDDERVLYNAVILPHLRYDNIVHFIGFGAGGIAVWEALSITLFAERHAAPPPLAAGVTVWLFGMGLGALNEVVEFAIALNVEESNVGGYLNTGRDLVANLLGAAVAGLIVARRSLRRSIR